MKNAITEAQIHVSRTLRNLAHKLRKNMDQALQPLDLNGAQYSMLAALLDSPKLSGAEIARKCNVTPQSAHQLLSNFEANHWIKREQHPTNEKVLLLEITKEGEKLLNKARPERLKVLQTMLKGFSTSELNGFKEFLERCLENLPVE